MNGKLKFTISALVWAMMLIAAYATSAQTSATKNQLAAKKGSVSVASPPLVPVTGSGTLGQITKWVGINPSDGFVIGDSIITETPQGRIGIGTTTPTSTLTVAGTIEALNGYKFPDGTIQNTAFDPNKVVRSLNGLRGDLNLAAGTNITVTPSGGNTLTIAAPDVLTSVFHNATLTGNGTATSALGIADGGVGTPQLAINAVTAANIAPGNVVKGLNGLTDEVTLAAGSGITLTPVGSTLTIASTAADPEKNAFQRSVGVNLAREQTLATGTIDVPSGKRLIIEYVSIVVGVGTENDSELGVNDIALTTTVSGHSATYSLQHGPIKHNESVTDKVVRIYSDGDVKLTVEKFEDGSAFARVTVSGRLIDNP
jgi:hypothetical protein